MSGYSYRNVGKFDSEQDVDEWVRKNRIDTRDLKTRKNRDGSIDADVREDAYDSSSNDIFGGHSRESGFQW